MAHTELRLGEVWLQSLSHPLPSTSVQGNTNIGINSGHLLSHRRHVTCSFLHLRSSHHLLVHKMEMLLIQAFSRARIPFWQREAEKREPWYGTWVRAFLRCGHEKPSSQDQSRLLQLLALQIEFLTVVKINVYVNPRRQIKLSPQHKKIGPERTKHSGSGVLALGPLQPQAWASFWGHT